MHQSRHSRAPDAREVAEQILGELGRLGLAPTPENYRVLFTHQGGTIPELSQRFAALLASGRPVLEEHCSELHERFFGTGREERRVQAATQRLHELAQALLQQIEATSGHAEGYGTSLGEVLQAFDAAGPASPLESLLAALVGETTRMRDHAGRLEQHLRSSAEQITSLRRDLLAAWREARTDALTGLANRKQFDIGLRATALQAVQDAAPACLMLADIDHFKSFNDSHGHATGDDVLRLVATVLRQQVKGRDLVARYGGEEFAILLGATRLKDAFTLADTIREAMASRRLRLAEDGNLLGRVTLSIGVCEHRPPEPVGSWLERTDAALYQAKRSGRNRVVAVP